MNSSEANSERSHPASPADVVIVGGGIWGLSIAFHLAKRGSAGRIVVLERNLDLADETTRQAAGQIGQLRSQPVMARAVKYTLDLLCELRARSNKELDLQTPGSLHLALNEERLDAFRRQIPLAKEYGIEAEIVEPSQAARIAPSIDPRHIHAALFVHGDGYVDARQAALAYGRAALAAGATLHCGSEVTGFRFDASGAVEGVVTNIGTIDCGQVVLAAGPWTAQLSQRIPFGPQQVPFGTQQVPFGTQLAGFVLPTLGIRLQQARTAVDPQMPSTHPVIRIPDASSYLRPERGGYLFGYFDPSATVLDPRRQPQGFRTKEILPPKEIVEESIRLLGPIFPVLTRLPIDEYRQGMLGCSPDGWYVLGPMPGHAGMWLATSCGGMGISGSGAVGKWLAEWISAGSPDEDLSPMDPARFAGMSEHDLHAACRRTYANYYSLQRSATYSMGAK